MENTVNKETRGETERKWEFHRVINKIRNLPKPNEAALSTSNTNQIQPEEDSFEIETQGFAEIETISFDYDNTIAVPAINFKRYLGATGVPYINMGQASKVQDGPQWDLEETIHPVKQKFATDIKPITEETMNDDKPLKTLICLGRQTGTSAR